MNIIRENKYTMVLSEHELRILYTAMCNYSKGKTDVEMRITEDIYCALH